MEDRHLKYIKNDRTNRSLEGKLDIKFDIVELSLICSYVISENKAIHYGGLNNVRHMMEIINLDVYKDNPTALSKIAFINKALNARLEKNLVGRDLILRDIAGGMGANNLETYPEISKTEIDWVNQSISEILKYSHIQVEAGGGIDILTRLESSNFSSRAMVIKELEAWVTNVQNKLRRNSIESAEDLTFSLENEKLQSILRETHRQVTAPQNILKFGTQALNLVMGGGAYAKRVYVILGLPGEGKSATLLEMAQQIKKYNSNYKCKDPTKKPCVLLLNMENDTIETVERLFSMLVQHRIQEFSEDQAVQMFMKQGLYLNDNSPINLVIKYKQGMSVDTSYIDTLIDNLSDEGYEVICVLLDYLKRIKSRHGNFKGDLRLELGSIVNELKIIATARQIPIITASQLNRTATSNIDTAKMRNKNDLVRVLGRSNVAESNLILENADWIAQIAPEESAIDKVRYLGIQCVKRRYYVSSGNQCVFIPYITDTIKLVEDIGSAPCHKTTLGNDKVTLNNGMSSNVMGSVNQIKSFTNNGSINIETTEDSLFLNSSGVIAYNMQPKKRKIYTLIRNSK